MWRLLLDYSLASPGEHQEVLYLYFKPKHGKDSIVFEEKRYRSCPGAFRHLTFSRDFSNYNAATSRSNHPPPVLERHAFHELKLDEYDFSLQR